MPVPLTLDQRVAQRLGQLSLQILSMQAQVEELTARVGTLTEERDRLLNELAAASAVTKEPHA